MNLAKIVKGETGRYIMSIILGFGLATIFRVVCKDNNCIVFRSPPLSDIDDKIYKHDGKCYTYTANQSKCDSKKKSVDVSDSSYR